MKKIKGGLYFIVDITSVDKLGIEKLCEIVEKAIKGGVDIIQIWAEEADWRRNFDELCNVSKRIIEISHEYKVPVLVANDVGLCLAVGADGVHLDGYEIPKTSAFEIKRTIGEDKIVGVTCGNDIGKIKWAKENGVDYISFCSVFPSASVSSCEIVPLDMIKRAKEILGDDFPVFASGGIAIENVDVVLSAGVDGVAVISAIMRADDPEMVSSAFKTKINEVVR